MRPFPAFLLCFLLATSRLVDVVAVDVSAVATAEGNSEHGVLHPLERRLRQPSTSAGATPASASLSEVSDTSSSRRGGASISTSASSRGSSVSALETKEHSSAVLTIKSKSDMEMEAAIISAANKKNVRFVGNEDDAFGFMPREVTMSYVAMAFIYVSSLGVGLILGFACRQYHTSKDSIDMTIKKYESFSIK